MNTETAPLVDAFSQTVSPDPVSQTVHCDPFLASQAGYASFVCVYALQAKIKQAELVLRTYSLQPGFGIAVLRVSNSDQSCLPGALLVCAGSDLSGMLQVVASEAPIEIRQAAAVNFKNLTKQRWVGPLCCVSCSVPALPGSVFYGAILCCRSSMRRVT